MSRSAHRPDKLASSLLLLLATQVSAAPRPEQVPLFHLRVRVISVAGSSPSGHTFPVQLASSRDVIHGADWSTWMPFDRKQAASYVSTYPATYIPAWPVVLHVQIAGIVDTTPVEAELRFDENGETTLLQWRASGPGLGFLIWREDPAQKPHAATMAVYNRRYWAQFQEVNEPASVRPRHFLLVDRLIGGDDDRTDWQEGIENLSRFGITALMLPPGKVQRESLAHAGGLRTAWAVYSPPGYAFTPLDSGKKADESPERWAIAQTKPYLDSGFAPRDIAWFAMSDEPGWYYPSQYSMLRDPAAAARFHAYLKSTGLQPHDLGIRDWESAVPIGRTQAINLASKRLFYWTQRFFSWDSARYFAECARALEHSFYPGLPIATNWNFFSGRLYVPGPAANNPDPSNPDAAMGGQDWLEFGRMRGGTVLWTEDWFPDSQAYQWSFYAAKLRSAAAKGHVNFGGYVVPRASGDREDGLLQKVLALVGNGAKAIESYIFGPEYAFPGNCYSDVAHVLPRLAQAYRMIGAADEVLWQGKTPQPQVAILAPRSAEMWDEGPVGARSPHINDATNTNLNAQTVDYMAETADLYLALQHANVPVDFIEEDDLTPERLAPYRAVYLTEPDVPCEYQTGLAAWVRRGGTLVTVSNAASMDRYDEPCDILQSLAGGPGNRRRRVLIEDLSAVKLVGRIASGDGQAMAWGARDAAGTVHATVLARFDDGSPAITQSKVESGVITHFSWLPGLSYMKSASLAPGKLPSGFSSVIRHWIVLPAQQAGVSTPVQSSVAMVETPVLSADTGAAVTLLNWNNDALPNLTLDLHLNFRIGSVHSVRLGILPFQKTPNGVRLSLPLAAADILVVKP